MTENETALRRMAAEAYARKDCVQSLALTQAADALETLTAENERRYGEVRRLEETLERMRGQIETVAFNLRQGRDAIAYADLVTVLDEIAATPSKEPDHE